MTKTRKCKTTGVDTTTNEAEATQEGELTARERAAVERLQTAEQAVRLVFTEDGKLTPDHQNKSVGWAQIAELLGSTNLDFAAGGTQQRRQHFDGCGFARSVGPEEGKDFAHTYLEADVADSLDLAKGFREMINANHRRQY